MARARTSSTGSSGAGPKTVLQFYNRTLTVRRGRSVNDAGDVSDVGAVFMTGVPVSMAEDSHDTFDQASSTYRTIRTVTCIAPNWAGIVTTDTLMDEFTGYFYIIESLQARPGIGYYPPQTILTLRQTTGVSVASGPAPAGGD